MSSRLPVGSFKQFVNKHLTLYNAIQTGFLMGGGDAIAQVVVEKKTWKEYDLKRSVKFFGLGAIFVGPTISTWYKFLDIRFAKQAGQLKNVLYKKVALDQCLFAPVFLVAIVASINVLQGKTLMENSRELKEKYPDILIANYKLWPWVQLLNFHYVPLRHQVLVVQTVALLWNTYISWKTHDHTETVNDVPQVI